MATNFMKELDSIDPLARLRNDPDHIEQMTLPAPREDYSDWSGRRTEIKLLNVKWDADHNVVFWKTEEERDAWFDNVEECYSFETNWNLLDLENYSPGLGIYRGSIIVDLPLEQALGFNYAAIDRYDTPAQESDQPVRSRFFFFITGVEQSPRSPNATKLIVELDAWTEYAPEGWKLVSVDLERGHWPTSQLSTADYLADPLSAEVCLTEPEPDLPSVKPAVSYERLTPLYGTQPLYIVCFTADLADPASLWSDGAVHAPSPDWWTEIPDIATTRTDTRQLFTSTYANAGAGSAGGTPGDVSVARPSTSMESARWAVQSPPVAEQTSAGGVGGAFPVIPASTPPVAGQLPAAVYAYAINPVDRSLLMQNLREEWPQVLESYKVSFVVPEEYVQLGRWFTFAGVSMQKVEPYNAPQKLLDLGITPDLFAYDEDFTKLYTGQFSEIEISDQAGHISTVSVQDIAGKLEVWARANTVFPFLKFEAFINGIGGNARNSHIIAPLTAAAYDSLASRWEEFRYEWDIPTYAIYIDGRTAAYSQAADLYNQLNKANREQALQSNSAYLSWANGMNSLRHSVDAAKLGAAVNLQDSIASANTAETNSNAAASTVNANAGRSVATAYSNAASNASNTQNNASLNEQRRNQNTIQDIGRTYENALDNNVTQNTITNDSILNSTNNSNISASTALDDATTSTDQAHLISSIARNGGMATYDLDGDMAIARGGTTTVYNGAAMVVGGAGIALQAATGGTTLTRDPQGGVTASANPGGTTAVSLGNSNGAEMLGVSTNVAVIQNATLAAAGMAYHLAQLNNTIDQISQARSIFSMTAQEAMDSARTASQEIYNRDNAAQIQIIENDNTTQTDNEVLRFENEFTIFTRNQLTDTANETLRNTTEIVVIGNDYSTAMGVAARTRDTGNANRAATYSTDVANAGRANNTAVTNAQTEYNAAVSANHFSALDNGKQSLDNALAVDLGRADIAVDNARMIARGQLNKAFAQAPKQLGSFTGDGSVDQWARRGVDIRVRRVSKADEKTITRAFRRWGYRMPENTWVTPDSLVPDNDRFWFWKARDVWATSKEMSETARRSLRDKLIAGVTVWDSPENVMEVTL